MGASRRERRRPRGGEDAELAELADEALDPRAGLLDAGTVDHYQDAALYDFEYKDRTEDVSWYRALARERLPRTGTQGARTVLELGAGTGRIACRMAQDG